MEYCTMLKGMLVPAGECRVSCLDVTRHRWATRVLGSARYINGSAPQHKRGNKLWSSIARWWNCKVAQQHLPRWGPNQYLDHSETVLDLPQVGAQKPLCPGLTSKKGFFGWWRPLCSGTSWPCLNPAMTRKFSLFSLSKNVIIHLWSKKKRRKIPYKQSD